MNNVKLRPYTQDDWMTFMGTEGEDPLIAYVETENWPETHDDGTPITEVAVIVDDYGIGVIGLDGMYRKWIDPGCGKLIAESLVVPINTKQLEELGFDAINFE